MNVLVNLTKIILGYRMLHWFLSKNHTERGGIAMRKMLIRITVFVIWAAMTVSIFMGLKSLYAWHLWKWSAGEITIIMVVIGLAVIATVYLIADASRKTDALWFAVVFIATLFLAPVFQKIFLKDTWLPLLPFFFVLPSVFVTIGMVIHGHKNFWAPLKKSIRWAAIIMWAMFLGLFLSLILLNNFDPSSKNFALLLGIAMGSCLITIALTAIASLLVLSIKNFVYLNLRAFKQEYLEIEVAEEDTDKDFAASPI
jgi:hypothetical protein